MKLRPPSLHCTVGCVVFGRTRSSATSASCILASPASIAPSRRIFTLNQA